MKILLGIILTAIIANANCFDKDRLKSIELFEKAFKKSNVNIKNLRDFSKNNDTAVIVTFDDGSTDEVTLTAHLRKNRKSG